MSHADNLSSLAIRFLARYLACAPSYPSIALMRSWEAAHFVGLELATPLLDLGCGNGSIVESLLELRPPEERPPQVYGLDIEPALAAAAGARPAFRAGIAGDARRQPFHSDLFGSAIAVCVLEHIADVDAVLTEVHRVLKRGGLFAFSVPTPHLLAVGGRLHPKDPNYVRRFNERVEQHTVWDVGAWQAAIQSAGLRVQEVRGFMPPDAAQAWFRAYDWVVRPIPGRGRLYYLAGPNLRRFGLGRMLAAYWFRRLRHWAEVGVTADLNEACALLVVAVKP